MKRIAPGLIYSVPLALAFCSLTPPVRAELSGRVPKIGVLMTVSAAATAQQPAKPPRLCFLVPFPVATRPHLYNAFLEGLRELGHIDGQTIAIHYLSADGRFERFPALAAECLRLKADVILTHTTPGALAAKHATTSVPIVMMSGDPVGLGLVASLARPGGNITGQTNLATDLSAKRLELLKEAVPRISRVAVLSNPTDPVVVPQLKELESAARTLGIRLRVHEVRTLEEIERAFEAIAREGADGLYTVVESLTVTHRDRVTALAAQHRLPAIYPQPEFAHSGGLMAYAMNLTGLFRRAAVFVDKVLKGIKPGDIPIEQPMRFELVVNLKTAKALGLTIPQSILVRADQVIL